MSDVFNLTGQSHQNHRNGDPETSKEAGVAAAEFSRSHHRDIHDTICAARRPMAAEEIADYLGWSSHVSVCRRLPELVDAGLITPVNVGYRNRSGRHALSYQTARPSA
jgi:predicted ArsR family transcriptional regulator